MKAVFVLLAAVAATSAHLIAPVVPIQQGFASSHQTIKYPAPPAQQQQAFKVPAKQFGNYQFFVAQPPAVQYQPQYQTIQYRPPYQQQYYQQQYYLTYPYANYYYPTYYPFRR